MIKKTFDVRALAQFMSKPEHLQYVNGSPNHTEKRKRIEELRKKFLSGQSEFSSVNFSAENFDAPAVKFSAAVEDVGNESFSFMNDAEFNFDEYNKEAKAETAIFAIKRLVATHNVRDNAKAYALKRNEVVKRNRAKKAEADNLRKHPAKGNISHPFFY